MATIRKIKSKWQVQIRRKGIKPISKSFHKKADAQTWSREQEREVDRLSLQYNPEKLKKTTWAELLIKYRDSVVINKKSISSETALINGYMKREPDTASLSLIYIKPFHFHEYRDKRLKTVKPATVAREIGLFHHIFKTAKSNWGLPIDKNPLADVRKPKIYNRRDRRLKASEYLCLLRSMKYTRNIYILPIIKVALHTGMRRGEILNIQRNHINFKKCTLFIPDTKTGYSREIPISKKVRNILNLHITKQDKLFPISANSFQLAWQRILKRSEITNLHFHDLRHEAISRFFEKGLTIPEVALISGHRSYAMLARYVHLKAEDIVDKL